MIEDVNIINHKVQGQSFIELSLIIPILLLLLDYMVELVFLSSPTTTRWI